MILLYLSTRLFIFQEHLKLISKIKFLIWKYRENKNMSKGKLTYMEIKKIILTNEPSETEWLYGAWHEQNLIQES